MLVWPESMYRRPLFDFAPEFKQPKEMPFTPPETADKLREQMRDLYGRILPPGTAFLGGADRTYWFDEERAERFNTAIFLSEKGELGPIYDKQHLVPFGEFIPGGTWFPWIYRISHLSGGLSEGTAARCYTIETAHGPVRIAPNICYETVIPHVPRRQLLELHARGDDPDVLVNVTNDGWFYGSGQLDMHLHCGALRAIETRKPLLIAANTGFSAAIDPHGRITAQGLRHQPDLLFVQAQVLKDRPRDELTYYVRYGEVPGQIGFAAACVGFLSVFVRRRSTRV
ncbi:MAG: apolipoprotein N-acyltransferase [Pirellulales bacterium]